MRAATLRRHDPVMRRRLGSPLPWPGPAVYPGSPLGRQSRRLVNSHPARQQQSVSTASWYNTTFGCVIPLTSRYLVYQECAQPPGKPPNGSAETHLAILRRAKLDVRNLVRRHQDLAALGHRDREDRLVATGQRTGQQLLKLVARRVGLHDQLARDGLDA